MKRIISMSLVGLLLWSCGNPSEILDNFTIRVSPELFEHSAVISVYDANDSTQLDDVTITMEGPNADDVYSILGSKDFTTTFGILEVALHKNSNPTPSAPTEVKLHVSAPGYMGRFYNLVFSADQPTTFADIPLVSLNNPPAGVKFSSESASLSNGALTSAKTVNIAPGAASEYGMEISMPAGLEFFDENGNKLTGSQVEIIAGHFDTESEQSLSAFPGGFELNSVTLADGTVTDGTFLTAGFTSIDMTVGGQEVHTFSQPITISMDVSDQLVNPETGAVLAVGDQIPIWSYNDATDEWGYEKVGTVVNGSNGLQVVFDSDHLSYWNLDFHQAKCCNTNCGQLRFNIPEWADRPGVSDEFRVRIIFPGTPQPINWAGDRRYTLYDGKTFQMYNTPNSPVVIRVWHRGRPVATTDPVLLCSGTIDVNLSNVREPQVPISLDVRGYCEGNSSISIRPSITLFYRNPNAPSTSRAGRWQVLERVIQGQAFTTKLKLGTTYQIGAYLNGILQDTTVTVDQTNYDIDYEMGDYCDNL